MIIFPPHPPSPTPHTARSAPRWPLPRRLLLLCLSLALLSYRSTPGLSMLPCILFYPSPPALPRLPYSLSTPLLSLPLDSLFHCPLFSLPLLLACFSLLSFSGLPLAPPLLPSTPAKRCHRRSSPPVVSRQALPRARPESTHAREPAPREKTLRRPISAQPGDLQKYGREYGKNIEIIWEK